MGPDVEVSAAWAVSERNSVAIQVTLSPKEDTRAAVCEAVALSTLPGTATLHVSSSRGAALLTVPPPMEHKIGKIKKVQKCDFRPSRLPKNGVYSPGMRLQTPAMRHDGVSVFRGLLCALVIVQQRLALLMTGSSWP